MVTAKINLEHYSFFGHRIRSRRREFFKKLDDHQKRTLGTIKSHYPQRKDDHIEAGGIL